MAKMRELFVGQKFGKLTIVRRAPNRFGQHTTFWECRCACGKATIIRACNLNAGTKSCGCRGPANIKHGYSTKAAKLQERHVNEPG